MKIYFEILFCTAFALISLLYLFDLKLHSRIKRALFKWVWLAFVVGVIVVKLSMLN